jgi:tRNA A-37 threonylcarbamoyl transferase component Bud32
MKKKQAFILLLSFSFLALCGQSWSAVSGVMVRTDVQHALIEINGAMRPEWAVTEFNKTTGFWEKEIGLPSNTVVTLTVLSPDRKKSCAPEKISIKDSFLAPIICTRDMMSQIEAPTAKAQEGLSLTVIAGVLIVLAGAIITVIFFYRRNQEAQKSVLVAAKSSIPPDAHEGHGRMLGEMLIESGIINEEQLEQALAVQKTKEERIGKILEDLGFASKDVVTKALSEKLNIQIITYTGQVIPSGLRQDGLAGGIASQNPDRTQLILNEMDKTGSFEIVRLLSDQGGMADVYEAYQPSLKRKVAAKKLKKEFVMNEDVRGRFEDEAIGLAKLNHSNIVQIIDFNKENLILFLEFIDGRTLDVILKEKGKLAVPEALRILSQILSGLQFAHDKGLVHRDIKPSNIFITKENEVKITDFGIAKIIGGDVADQSHKTRLGVWVGTPSYMSPEQFLGEEIDPRSDIYASGIMLYQLVTATLPFIADTPSQLSFMHTQHSPVSPAEISPDIPDELNGIILKALEKKPSDRFQSAREFRDALETFYENQQRLTPTQ